MCEHTSCWPRRMPNSSISSAWSETLDKLVRRAPRHPGVHHYVGELFAKLKLPDRAVASFGKAARLPGAGPPTWMELASLYEQSHRLDEAEELIERTVRAGYDLPMVGLVRGRIQQRQNTARTGRSDVPRGHRARSRGFRVGEPGVE